MILLDTDHASLLKYHESDRASRLIARMALSEDKHFGVTIITVEEQMRGWLASIAKERQPRRQVASYRELAGLFKYFAAFEVVHFNDAAALRFDELRKAKVRAATMDLKIAAIALVNDALLLTANKRDFEQVPDLRIENWMD